MVEICVRNEGKQFVYKILVVEPPGFMQSRTYIYCGVTDILFSLTKMRWNPFCHILCFSVFPVSEVCHGRMAVTEEGVLNNCAVLWF
jgi:hypothetical protein